MTMRPLVYIAGPYTRPDPVDNTRTACTVGELVEAALDVDVVIPHLTLLRHFLTPAPLDEWYRRDLNLLVRCDALYRFPGVSTGADREIEFADRHGIPVFCAADVATIPDLAYDWRDAYRAEHGA